MLPILPPARTTVAVLDEYSRRNSNTNKEELITGAHKVISTYRRQLDEAGAQRYNLCALLSAMLDCAPTVEGSRYVAVALYAAAGQNDEGRSVVGVAKGWLNHLLLPILYMSSGERPIEDVELKAAVAKREHDRCAITGTFDRERASALFKARRPSEVPRGPPGLARMAAARILPLDLSHFRDDETTILRGVTLDAERTWDMLHAWTQLDPDDVRRPSPKIASPANGIYMSRMEHEDFPAFKCYLDKNAFPGDPNKYEAISLRPGLLTSGSPTATVVFRDDTGVDPPKAEYIAIHAAFAQVLHRSGIAKYFERLQLEKERATELYLEGNANIGQALEAHLASLPDAVFAA
ncbi:hypothetical protein FB451DRAFT_1245392 [Mycena latifolia]|nr:hypothetical protein FB451DRAFT_1245392 [Mycena latifolia]